MTDNRATCEHSIIGTAHWHGSLAQLIGTATAVSLRLPLGRRDDGCEGHRERLRGHLCLRRGTLDLPGGTSGTSEGLGGTHPPSGWRDFLPAKLGMSIIRFIAGTAVSL